MPAPKVKEGNKYQLLVKVSNVEIKYGDEKKGPVQRRKAGTRNTPADDEKYAQVMKFKTQADLYAWMKWAKEEKYEYARGLRFVDDYIGGEITDVTLDFEIIDNRNWGKNIKIKNAKDWMWSIDHGGQNRIENQCLFQFIIDGTFNEGTAKRSFSNLTRAGLLQIYKDINGFENGETLTEFTVDDCTRIIY